ncbi:MAG: hypothetical protein JXA06_11550 [Bacteroidetes bacterium]|nr:hypothetical protein [Bacteroidota bacterium]
MVIKSRHGIIIVLYVLAILQVRGQGIELIRDFEIINGTSFPLKEYDKGVSFQYVTQMGAKVKSFLKIGNESRLLADNIEIKGLSVLSISPNRLREWFVQVGEICSDIVFYLQTVRTQKSFEKRYRLSFAIDAPYGNVPLQEPTKPNLLPTNVTKKTTNGLAIGGLVVSAGMIIGGVKVDGGGETKINDPLFYGGLLLGLLSLTNLSSWESDEEANERNRISNNELEWRYQQEHERVYRTNQLIQNSFRISVRIIQ